MALNAMIAELSFSGFGNTRQDPKITEETKQAHNLTGKVGKWTKFLIPPKALEGISKARTAAYLEHSRLTLPWGSGSGILGATGREQYERRMEVQRNRWNTQVEQFLAEYESKWILAAREMHKETFDASVYPTLRDARAKFRFVISIFPMPQAEHFGEALRPFYGEQCEREVNKRVGEAMTSMWDRILDPIRKMSERLAQPDAIFRDSLVENVREIVEVTPTLNVTNDRRINEVIQQIGTQLASLDPEKLRTDKVARSTAASAANNILATFGAMGTRALMIEDEPTTQEEP